MRIGADFGRHAFTRLRPPKNHAGPPSAYDFSSTIAEPSIFFGRHWDHADPLKLQAQILQELAHLAGTAPQSGQLKDAFARLGYSTDGLLLDGLADQLAIGSHLADRAIDVPLPQTVQAPLSKCGHVPLDSGPTHADNLGSLLLLALGYIEPDAASSLTKSRVALEKLVLKVYSLEMTKVPRKPLLGTCS